MGLQQSDERGQGVGREAEGLDVLLPWQQHHLEGVDVQGGRAEQTSIITTPANHGQRLERHQRRRRHAMPW
jgi:hypothetical protein